MLCLGRPAFQDGDCCLGRDSRAGLINGVDVLESPCSAVRRRLCLVFPLLSLLNQGLVFPLPSRLRHRLGLCAFPLPSWL